MPGARIPTSTCRVCSAQIVFARTVASERGPGGKVMPLDAKPNPEGNVAVRIGHAGRLYARVLTKDEDHDHRAEARYMPHFATCSTRLRDQLASEAEAFLAGHTQKGDTTT